MRSLLDSLWQRRGTRFGAGISIARRLLGARLRFEVQPRFVAAILEAGA